MRLSFELRVTTRDSSSDGKQKFNDSRNNVRRYTIDLFNNLSKSRIFVH